MRALATAKIGKGAFNNLLDRNRDVAAPGHMKRQRRRCRLVILWPIGLHHLETSLRWPLPLILVD